MSSNFDFDGESAVPPPIPEAVRKFLGHSISLADILRRLLKGWLFAMLGALLGAIMGIYLIWTTPPIYTVQVTLLPLEAGQSDLSGGGGVGISVLTSILGSSGPVSKFTRFVASFYSTGMAKYMDKRYDYVCKIYNCDPKTRAYEKHSGFFFELGRLYTQIAHMPDPDAPHGYLDLANFIYNNVVFNSDRNTRMLVVSMDSKNADFASNFLVDLVTADNDYIKEQDNSVIRKEIEYVTQQLKTNTDLAQRQALTNMLADEEQHLMLTNVDLPYVAQIQDGPTVTSSNSSVRFFAAFVMFGFMIGGALGIGLTFLPQNRRPWSPDWQKS